METVALPSQITVLPNTDLYVPDWNPRKTMEEEPLRLLTDCVRQGKRLERILAWKGEDKAPYAVISGQRRLEAYRRAGVERVEVDILDITLEEARFMASTANEGEPVYWLERFGNWESLLTDYSGWGGITALASKLGKDRTEVNRAINLMKLLTPKARKMIQDHRLQNAAENNGNNATRDTVTNSEGGDVPRNDTWELRERVAARLNGLWKGRNLADAQDLAERAIPQMLSKQMTASQVDQWVQKVNGEAPRVPKTPLFSPKKTSPLETTPSPVRPTGASEPTPSHPANLFPKSRGAKAMVLGGLAGAVGGFLASNFKRVLGTLTRRYILHWLAVLGIAGYFGSQWYGSRGHLVASSINTPRQQTKPVTVFVAVATPVPAQPINPSAQVEQKPKSKAKIVRNKTAYPNPSGAGTSVKGEDLVKQIGDGEKKVQGAVSTVDDAKATSDKIKSVFGF